MTILKKTTILTIVSAIALVLVISTPFFSSAATTVTIQTNAASYTGQAGTKITVSGAVSPAPGQSGYSVTLELNTTQGLLQVFSTPVDATSGAYSYTITTGYATNGWINGTYTVEAVYATSVNGPTYTATTTFQYGAVPATTSTTSSSAAATTATTTVTTTVHTTATVTTSLPGTTITQPTTVVSTVTAPTVTTTTIVSSATWMYVGIGGIVAAVVLAGLAGFLLMRKH